MSSDGVIEVHTSEIDGYLNQIDRLRSEVRDAQLMVAAAVLTYQRETGKSSMLIDDMVLANLDRLTKIERFRNPAERGDRLRVGKMTPDEVPPPRLRLSEMNRA